MLRLRPLAVFLSLALALCLLGLWGARSQTGAPRRVTNTTAEGLNLNPSLSGNGRRIAFESTEDVAGAGGGAFFRAIRADISRTPAAFVQMAGARAPAPGISQDGSAIAFAARENPLGTNADGNSEIFLHNGAGLRQVTNTTPNDISRRASDGNYQPSLSDDGRYVAFSSNRNLTGQNSDGNFEIFVFDATANSFSQLTNTAGGVGATDAKISGNGARIAYIRDSSALPAVQRDLMLQDRTGGVTRLAADNVTNLALTYGRAISDDGSRVVFAGDTAADSSQVFLYDARTNSARAVTSLGARDTEVPLHPTISGDGTRIAFAARRTVPSLGGNGDRSIELYTYDIPTGQFAVVTNAPSEADGFQGSTRVAEVVSSLSDDGSVVAFNFPRALSEEVETGLENNSEIYVSGTAARPTEGTLEVLNGASFGHEPSTTEAVAPESYAVALGGALSFETAENERLPDGTYPTTAGGTTVTVNGRRAQIVSASPTRVDFLVPAATELGTATVVVTNEEGFRSVGTVEVKAGAPGIFTKSGDGTGEGDIVNAQTRAPGPFDPTNGELRLIIFTTGVRNASEVTARAGGHALAVESVTESATRPGTDEVLVRVPAALRGAGSVDLFVRADDRDSNPVTVTFTGVAPRPDIVINEVLADPPTDDDSTAAIEGDANRDGVRDTSQDEFVELVNTTGRDINIGGYQLFTRGTTAASDTLRHTFAAGTILPAGAAVVVFGGGNPNPHHPAFGGAQVFTASEGELSLVNTGGVVTLRDANQTLVTIFSYGGSTGLNGGSNQSLTRSPDITGAFTLHTTAAGSNGSAYSPGTRVNGQPFTSPAIARIEVTPASASIAIGQSQQFTATAYNAAGNPMSGVIFTWESSNTTVATIDENGLATGRAEGTTQIRARARGVTSAPATLTVRFVPRTLTSVEVTPAAATIPVGGQQQFMARGLDQFGNEMTGLTFTWESTNTSVATVDQSGLATGVAIGTTTIRASTGGKTGAATLNVTPPKIVIHEALADPPGSADTDLQGDANRDGERDASQDEFVELVNSSSAAVDISGWTVRTRSLDGTTETVRHTFAAGTTVPANSAIVVFGGGNENFDPGHTAFGCAQVVKASSGRLSLLNSGETIVITDANGNLTARLTYGSAVGLNGGSDQSMTRSPDVTGGFTLHTAAANSGGRAFSPGVKVDGTPFGNCPARLTSVTIQPTSQSVIIGRTTQFTAQARDQFGRPMKGVAITFTSDNTSVATVDSVTINSTTGVATATVRGRSAGTARITARATSGAT
ncbi:MAG TPA: lamin tail domain-containing protein, partial [Pyrinomonadaceae bacterium]|nr:lamin tail domain-containing protein [Pyrinomonadaceae bacterium]